jgi:rRNA-processing protein FCF1
MQKVLVDTCGWVAIVEAGLHLDQELSNLVGTFELVLLKSVDEELQELQAQRSSTLLLDLLEKKSVQQETPADVGNHTDDHLLALAKANSWPVITVDTGLKQKLLSTGCQVIEVAQHRRLRMLN